MNYTRVPLFDVNLREAYHTSPSKNTTRDSDRNSKWPPNFPTSPTSTHHFLHNVCDLYTYCYIAYIDSDSKPKCLASRPPPPHSPTSLPNQPNRPRPPCFTTLLRSDTPAVNPIAALFESNRLLFECWIILALCPILTLRSWRPPVTLHSSDIVTWLLSLISRTDGGLMSFSV